MSHIHWQWVPLWLVLSGLGVWLEIRHERRIRADERARCRGCR